MDVFAIRKFWGEWDLHNLTIMLPAAVAGVLLGTLTFSYLNDAHVRLIIGFLALAFALNFWFKSNLSVKQKPNRIKGVLWSTIAGFTSFGIHAGGHH